MGTFIREKKIYCGADYLEVDIFPYTETQIKARQGKRSKKTKVSRPEQQNLNSKNAKRYFVQLASSNFVPGDLVIHLTYDKEFLPLTLEDALKIVINFLRRVASLRKKRGLSSSKYMLVTHRGKKGRIHHHILMNGGLDRDEVEGLWWKVKGKKGKGGKMTEPVMYGFANARRLQPNSKGITQISGYMARSSLRSDCGRRWTQSQNLDKPIKEIVNHGGKHGTNGEYSSRYSANLTSPYYRTNDHKYSRGQIEKLAKNLPPTSFWEKRYKGYSPIDGVDGVTAEYNEYTGWSLYLKMRKNRRL